MPVISIILPNYNGLPYLAEAVESVLAQTHTDWELLVVDDASSDGSADFIREAAANDARIVPILFDGNGGVSRARNEGLSQAKGRYVAYLDSDDVWYPAKLEKQLKLMQEKNAPISHTGFAVLAADGNVRTRIIPRKPLYAYADILKYSRMGISSVMLDRNIVPDLRFSLHVQHEDYRYFLNMMAMGHHAWLVPEVLTAYRLIPASRNADKVKAALDVWQCLREQDGLSVFEVLYYFSCYALYNLTRGYQLKRLIGIGE